MNNYINMLNFAYQNGTNNHEQHNNNPDYHSVLLKEIISNNKQWENKIALDFGCGKGRNITNLLKLANWKRVDGVDISQANIDFCKSTMDNTKSIFIKNNGSDLSDLASDSYDFVMSTIVFQHICVHELRIKLKREIYRILSPNGVFSFQMGYNKTQENNSYFANKYDSMSSNGCDDVDVSDENHLINDLKTIGFKNIQSQIKNSWCDSQHPDWIYISCNK